MQLNDSFCTILSEILQDLYCVLTGSNSLKLKHLNDEFVSYKHTAFHFTRH